MTTVPSIWRGPVSPEGRAWLRSYSAKSWPKDSVVSVGSLDSGVGFESGVVGVDMNCGCLEKCGLASISPRAVCAFCADARRN